jgi:cellulase
MGMLPESGKISDVSFFKIDEATYNPKTMEWGTDLLIKNKNEHTVTIPSDIKSGTYVLRHEIISLHNALNDDFIKKSSGAQFYPQCAKIKVIGGGTATPSGSKFPGLYKWDEKGILINIFYRPNEYFSPGPPLYKSAVIAPPKGEKPVVASTGALTGEIATVYKQQKAKADQRWVGAVHGTDAKRRFPKWEEASLAV